jgi:hypothetical protein
MMWNKISLWWYFAFLWLLVMLGPFHGYAYPFYFEMYVCLLLVFKLNFFVDSYMFFVFLESDLSFEGIFLT